MNKKLIVLATLTSSLGVLGALRVSSLEKTNGLITSYLLNNEEVSLAQVLEIDIANQQQEAKLTIDFVFYSKFLGIHFNSEFVKDYITKIDNDEYDNESINKYLTGKIEEQTTEWNNNPLFYETYGAAIQAEQIAIQVPKIREAYHLNQGIYFKFQGIFLWYTIVDNFIEYCW